MTGFSLAPTLGSSPIGVAYRRRNDPGQTTEFVSEGVQALTGYSAEDFTSGRLRWTEVVHPDDADRNWQAVEQALREGRPFHLEYRIRLRDGSERWVWEQGHGILRDGREPAYLEGFVSDITGRKRVEEELATARQQLEAHLDNSPLAVIEFDRESRIVRWSGGAERLFGWGAVEVLGRGVFDLPWVHEGDTESIRELIEDMQSQRLQRTRSTNRNYRKDGSIVHCAWYNSAISGAEDRLTSILSLVLDVTDRKQSEEALKEARAAAERRAAELEVLLQAVPAAVWIAHDPECLSARGNRTADEWLRLPPGGQASLTAPEGQRPTHFKIFQDGRELRGEELPVQRAARGEVVKDFEVEIRLSDGSVRFTLGNATPLLDERGQPRGAVAAFVDITARKQAEEALRQSQADLSRAQALGHIGSWRLDLRTNTLTWSDENSRIFGIPASTPLTYEAFLATVHPDDRDYVDRMWQAGRRGAPYDIEHRLLVDGKVKWVRERAELELDDAGKVVGGFGTTQDITDRKEAEEALREADRRKDVFLAVLAHELRNPLAPIRNALEILKLRGSSDPISTSARDMIERQVAHLVRLIEDLMDVGRITRGKLQLRREPFELAATLERAAETIRPQMELAGLRLELSVPPEPLWVDADPVRLTQVLLNLLDNACKYTGEGGTVTLFAEQDGEEVEIRVSDTGIGVRAEDLPVLFQMFARVGGPSERIHPGLGIGLALARGLVEMHGGRIEARSEGLGRGATFVLRLPVLSELPSAAPQPDQHESLGSVRPQRILIADDNRDVVESLALLLELTGYRVEKAYDGLQAVETAERCRPDLVLLDIGMPNLDGYEACRRIRQQPWGRDMLLVALTGWGQEDDRRRSERAGFNSHLVKPVERSDLLRLLAEWQA